jgi:hypothetical protein
MKPIVPLYSYYERAQVFLVLTAVSIVLMLCFS